MKHLVVFALCATAAVADLIVDSKSLDKFQTDCLAENKLTAAELEEDPNPIPFNNTCFYSCLFKKTGVMKEDGSYDIEGMLSQAEKLGKREEYSKVLNKLSKDCAAEAGNDPCKMGVCTFKFILEGV